MSLRITDQCINCDVCEPECPNEAIYETRAQYVIDSSRCTECVGHFTVPQCVQACPVDCIVIDMTLNESREDLQRKYDQLIAESKTVEHIAEKSAS